MSRSRRSVLAAIANSRTSSVLHTSHDLKYALTLGFHSAFMTGEGFALLGLLLGFALIRREDSRRHVETVLAEAPA